MRIPFITTCCTSCFFFFLSTICLLQASQAFVFVTIDYKKTFRRQRPSCPPSSSVLYSSPNSTNRRSSAVDSIEEASQLLASWDRYFNANSNNNSNSDAVDPDMEKLRETQQLANAVRHLNEAARQERNQDAVMGRCMLGICADSTDQGIAALKSWVAALELPRGLLHGMDQDGVPIPMEGGVYIKYNTGGSLTFAQIRQSGMGFDALWKPGDALVEPYDGTYRGVYFQVELQDNEFRQYFVPLDLFDDDDDDDGRNAPEAS